MTDTQYILQPSQMDGYWVATDKHNGIVMTFRHGRLNEDQKITVLEDGETDALRLASIVRKLTEWLNDNHPDKVG